MTSRRLGQAELTVAACFVMLAVLFLRSAALDPVARNDLETRLAELGRGDALLDQDLLRARLGLIEHYDGIVQRIEELARMRAELRQPPDFLEGAARAEYAERFDRYESAALAKEAAAERFKSTNAALRNSLIYFPIAARGVFESPDRPPPAELAAPLHALFEAVLQYEASGSARDRDRASSALAALEAAADSAEVRRQTDPVRTHVRNILERRPALDATVHLLVETPTARLIAELEEGFRRAAEVAQQRANGYRVMLYLCGVCLSAAMAYSFRALRKAKLGLEVMNRTLDRRVRERTLELETANRDLEQSQQELEKSKREQVEVRDRFLSHVSHELRTPLAALHQFLELLLDGVAGELEDEQRNFATLAYKNARQLEAMVRDLMEITRAESGKLRVEPRPLRLPALLEEIAAGFRDEMQKQSIAFASEIAHELPQALADATRVRQIVYNLVENAIKFTPEGGRIRLRARNASEPGFIEVSVRDTGRGIDADSLELVFDRLHQVSREDSMSRAGLGLGLAICRELVSRQGGRIWVESEPGEGSTFHFTLPTYSLCDVVRPAVVNDGRLRSAFGLLRVQLTNGESHRGDMLPSTRRAVAEQLRRIAYYPMDVLIPSEEDEVLFLVAGTDAEGVSALSERVRSNLTADAKLRALEVSVSARIEQVEDAERAGPLDDALPRIAERIAERMSDSSVWVV
jgi:signal transduction histidine kinase